MDWLQVKGVRTALREEMESMADPDLDVLAIGEILIDLISTEFCDHLRDAKAFSRLQGGAPANLAVNVARLGRKAAVIAKMGAGAFGQFLKQELEKSGVITNYLVMDPAVQTSLVFVSRTRGTPEFEPYRSGDYQLRSDEIPLDAVERARVIHTTTWLLSRQPGQETVLQVLKKAHAAGKVISFDPNYSPVVWSDHDEAVKVLRQVFAYVTFAKASLDDCQRMFGEGHSPLEYIQMLHALGPRTVVFTLGKEGSLLSVDGSLVGRLPSRPVQVVDATGAGDSFWAGFLVALLDGNPPERCLLFAREVVEQKLQTLGTLPVNLDRQELYSRLPPVQEAFLR
jgi:fructokinase